MENLAFRTLIVNQEFAEEIQRFAEPQEVRPMARTVLKDLIAKLDIVTLMRIIVRRG